MEIRKLEREATEPEKIAWLVETLDENYGYILYRAVSRLKEALSAHDSAEFRFEAGSVSIVQEVRRADFEGWIAPELAQIETAVDAALADAGLAPGQIDRVFLTGGSSLVPAVRDIFHRRFEAGRIETGAELELRRAAEVQVRQPLDGGEVVVDDAALHDRRVVLRRRQAPARRDDAEQHAFGFEGVELAVHFGFGQVEHLRHLRGVQAAAFE